jgi:hypothetical protein
MLLAANCWNIIENKVTLLGALCGKKYSFTFFPPGETNDGYGDRVATMVAYREKIGGNEIYIHL